MPIIFDEYEHVKKMLVSGFQTSNNNKFELQLLATYLRNEGLSDKQIELELHNFSKKYLNNYNKVKYYKIIDEKVKKSKKFILKRAYPVNVTQNELNTILKEDNYKCQKLMFVYLILAKYYMSNNHTSKYYVSCKDNDIFKLCDMYVRKQDKMDLMHYLTKRGYITPTLNMSSIVNYIDDNDDIVMSLKPDYDMVYYFERYLGGIFINCEICGKLVKKTNNRIKYCKDCAKKVKNRI